MKLLVMILSLIATGCAYKIGHQDRKLPEGYKTVFVSQFTNATKSVGAEAFFTTAMIRELKRSGFAFVADRNQAELVITGRIMMMDYSGTSTTAGFQTFPDPDDNNRVRTFNASLFTRYLLSAVAHVKVLKTVDNSVVWQSTFRGSKNFLAPSITNAGVRSANPLYNQSIRDENVRVVANEMMNEAFDQLTESF